MTLSIRGRYAPSPTGALHLGNARTALLAWLDIRSLRGTFVLRIEDLDPQRSSEASARQIIEDLRWLGLDWDEGPDLGGPYSPYRQDERRALYDEAIGQLQARGLAYPCTCTRAEVARAAGAPHAGEDGPRYPGTCRQGPTHPQRPSSIRLRVSPGAVAFEDLIAGHCSFDVDSGVGDFALRRSDGVAAYQLAVALDDALMQMTRVVRGDDLLSSTPRQLLVLEALGLPAPTYGHVPLVVGEDGHRLSKRGGSLTLAALRARGLRPERVVALLAESAGLTSEKEISASELVSSFSLSRITRTPTLLTDASLEARLW